MTIRRIFVAALILIGLSYFLSRVFSGYLILPQTFHFGPIVVYYYGIIIAFAVASAFYLALKRSAKFGIDRQIAEDIIFWLIIGCFIGARIYHILSSAGYYHSHPLDMLKVWQGGLSIYGAILGGLIVVLVLAISYKLKAISLLDWLTPSILLGQIVGRFGNLFNYEAFGYPTRLPWKMFVPQAFRPTTLENFQYFHPLFLYEALGNALILFFLLRYCKNSSYGGLFFKYLLLYNVLRLFLEFLRVDSVFIGSLRLNSLASLILAIFSLVVLLRIHYAKVS